MLTDGRRLSCDEWQWWMRSGMKPLGGGGRERRWGRRREGVSDLERERERERVGPGFMRITPVM